MSESKQNPQSRRSTLTPTGLAGRLFAAALFVATACTGDGPTAPTSSALSATSARVAFDSRVVYLGAARSQPINYIRAVVYDEQGARVAALEETLDPTKNTFGFQLPIPLPKGATNARVTLELANRNAQNELVEYSGRRVDLRLAPGDFKQVDIDLYPGPLANFDAKSVKITKPLPASFEGATHQAIATVDGGGSGVRVYWSSLDTANAKISDAGLITAALPGTARIVAAVGALADTASIEVLARVHGVAVAPASTDLARAGDSATFVATVTDARGAVLPGQAVTWTVANSAIASVSANGVVRGLDAGQTTITATSVSNPAASGSATVRVISGAVSLSQSTIGANPGSVQVNGTSVITVTLRDASGTLFGKSAGTVTMSATAGVLSPVTDNSDGTYSATLTAPAGAGTVTVSAKLGGASLTQTVDVTVSAMAPGAPADLVAVAGDAQVSLSWQPPANTGGTVVTGYELAWSADGGVTWKTMTVIGTSTTLTGLANGTAYTFKVRAMNVAGASSASPNANATPVASTAAPGAGTDLSPTPGNAQVALSWTAPASDGGAPITDYVIEHSTDGTNWIAFDDGVATATTATVTGLTNGVQYSFRVKAVNGRGTGPASGTASATPRTVPGAATITTVTPGDGELSVAFDAPASNGGSTITNYEYSTDNGVTWTTRNPASTASPIVITGLANGTSYTVKVRAMNAAGAGSGSNGASSTPRSLAGAPTITGITAGSQQLTVAFTAPSSDGGSPITNYQYSTDNGTTWATVSPASTTSPIVITGLTNGTTYQVKLRAVSAAGNGTASNAVSATPRTTPDAPSITGITPGDQQLSVAFDAPAATGGATVTNYEYSTDNGATWTTRNPASTTGPIVITGLTNGTTYQVKVRAINTAGTGNASDAINGTPRTVAGAPTALGASAGNAQADLNWTAPASTGGAAITDYVVEFKESSAGSFSVFNDGVSTTTSATVTGLTNGTEYTFQVKAVNAAGTGAASSPAAATPRAVAGAPSITSVTAGNQQLSIAFDAPSSNGGSTITNYEYSLDNGATWTTLNPASTSSPIVVTGLTNGTAYQVKLRAVNAAGSGSASNAVNGTPRTTAGAPAITGITPGDGQLSIAFDAPSSNGGASITNYEYSTNNGTSWTAVNPASTSSPIVVTGLTNGTTYQVKVRAVNAAGSGTASDAASGTPRAAAGAPAITSVTPGNQQLSVAFDAPSSNGGSTITNYEYSTNNGTNWTAVNPASTSSPIVITGLTNGTTYQVKVRAVNAAGAGTASDAANGTPRTTPGAPAITGIASGNGQLSVTFDAPSSNGGSAITNYEYSTDNGSNWTTRNPASANSPLVITGLTNGTSYTVKLRAINAAGSGPASDGANGTPATGATAPTITSITPGNQQLSVAFDAPSSNGGASITNYEYSTDNGSNWTTRNPAATASPIVVTGLTNGTTYQVKIRAVTSAGAGTASDAVSGTPRTVPGAPSITSITPGDQQLSIAFSAPSSTGGSSITNYEYSTDNGSNWTTRNPAATSSPIVVTGLTNGTTYQVKIRAINAAGTGTASDASSGTPRTVPSAPTGLGATPGNTEVALSWTAPSNGGAAITDYVIEYKETSAGSFSVFNDGTSTTASATVTGLTNGTEYTFQVKAVNAAGAGAASSTAAATPRQLASAPTITGITAGNEQLSVAFDAPSSNGGSAITNYEYSTDNGSNWTTRNPASTASPIAITGLTNGTAYQVKVRAITAAGSGAASDAVSGTPRTVPGAPTITGVTSGNGQLSVAFTAPSSNGGSTITNYEYSTDNGSNWTTRNPAATTSPIVITGLANGTSYDVKIRAVNAAGSGAASNAVSGTPATAASAPTITGITAGDGQLSVAFTAPSSNGGSSITNYEYSTDNGDNWTTRNPAATASPIVITGLTNGTTYQVKIRAVTSAGSGTASDAVSGTPRTTPAAPTITGVTAGNEQLSVAFTAGATGGSAITNYEYSTDDGSNWTARNPAATGSPIVITGLTNGTTYQVKIRAINAAGTGAASDASSGTPRTVPGAPTGLGATPGNTEVALSWTAPSNGGSAITDYIIEYKETSASSFSVFNDGTSTSASAAVTGLTNGTEYTFQVKAVNAAGTGAASSTVAATPRQVASAPTITGITPSNGQLSVAFNAPSSDGGSAITNYEYSTDNGSNWTTRNPVSTASPIVITGLTNGTAYQVKVRAVTAAGAGAASDAVSGTPRTTPGAPAITGITSGNGQLSVAFTAPSSNGGSTITNYEYSTDNGDNWTTRNPAATTSPIVITGLTNGTTYQVKIRAVNAAGSGTASDAVAGTPATTPSAPAITGITAGNEQLSVAFTVPSSNGGSTISNYEYSTDNGDNWTTRNPAATSSPIVITGLTNGTTYQVKIRAVNSAGAGTASDASSGTPRTTPSAPTITGITSGNGQLSVAFTAPSSNGGASLSNYEYSTDNGSNWTTRNPAATTSPIVITGLTNGTTYQVKIRAVNAAGSGTASDAVAGTPATTPSAPTITGITAGNGELSVAFSAPSSNGGATISNYEYSTDNGSNWTTRNPAATTSPIVITGLTNGTTYQVKIRAVNSAGSGTASDAAAGTPRATPSAPAIAGITSGNGQLSVAFTAPSSNGGSSITNYEYSTDNGTNWTLRDPAATTSPIVITGLTNGTEYQVRIRAVNAAGSGTASDAVAGTPATTPGAPTITGITPGDGQLSVAFTAGTTGGSALTNYEYSTDNGTNWTTRNPAATTSPIVITGLTNGTAYTVRIRAVNAIGSGTQSSSSTGTPAGVPSAPTITGITPASGSLSVAFTAPSNNGGSAITNYQYSTDGGSNWTTRSPAATTSPITISGLTNATTYTVVIRAVNAAGSGATSNSMQGTPGVPTEVQNLAVALNQTTASAHEAKLSWSAPASTGGSAITDYVIEYKTSASGTWTTFADGVSTTTNNNSTPITGLVNGTTYNFRVRAKNANGEGPNTQVNGTTTAPSARLQCTQPGSSNANVTSVSITGCRTNIANIIIVPVTLDNTSTTTPTAITAPAGFTKLVDNLSGEKQLTIFYKSATSSDTSGTASYSFSWTGSQKAAITLVAYKTWGGSAPAVVSVTGTGATASAGNVTTTANTSTVLYFFGANTRLSSTTPTVSEWTIAGSIFKNTTAGSNSNGAPTILTTDIDVAASGTTLTGSGITATNQYFGSTTKWGVVGITINP